MAKSGGIFSVRACRNCNRPVTTPDHAGEDCSVNTINDHLAYLPGSCWRCGSVDLRLRGLTFPYEEDDETAEMLFVCAGCDLIMSEGKQ